MKIDTDKIANQLIRSATERSQLPPLSSTWPAMTAADAYAIQMRMVQLKLDSGERIAGKKIGLTSLAMQQMLGVFEPDYGHLFESMCVQNGGKVPTGTLIQPKIEGEIAFVLKKNLCGPQVTQNDVLEATGYVVPALEIIDSRIRNWEIKLSDTIADNGSSALFVLGNAKCSVGDHEFSAIEMVLLKNGEGAVRGAGAAVMGNPIIAVAWLANKLATFGVTLRAGEVILSGSIGKAVDVHSGDYIRAEFGGLGSVEVSFV